VDQFGYANAECLNKAGTAEERRNALVASFDLGSPCAISIRHLNGGEVVNHAIVGDGYGYSDGQLYIHLNFGYGVTATSICGDNVFTANTPSGGNHVTMTVTATFCDVPGMDETPPKGTQGAVWLGTNGCFQVWTKAGNGEPGMGNGWVDVVADGVTPQTGVDYTFRLTFDYAAKAYSVAVQYGAEWKPLVGRVIPNAPTFPLATSASAVSGVRFTGDGVFTSMLGEWMKKNLGFVLSLF
jgi:hypothetical protein